MLEYPKCLSYLDPQAANSKMDSCEPKQLYLKIEQSSSVTWKVGTLKTKNQLRKSLGIIP